MARKSLDVDFLSKIEYNTSIKTERKKKMGFFEKLKQGLNKTKESFDQKINNVFSNFRKVDEEFLEELEEILIM